MRLFKITCIRMLLSIFWLFPIVKKRVVFVCHYGKAYACNPKYVYEALRETYGEKLQYIWVLNKRHEELDGQAIQVKNKSLAFFYYMLTARVIVGNNALGSYLPKRKSQCFINTWHGGGAYKRVHFDVAASNADRKIYEIFAKQTDCHLSSSKMFTDCMAGSTKVPKERFMEIGMPRNDCLIQSYRALQGGEKEAQEAKRLSLLKKLQIPESLWKNRFVLYAPTFRGDANHGHFENSMDVKAVLQSLQKRFGGEWTMLFRGHYKVPEMEIEQSIGVTDYEDMQEILLCADVLITDFSSVMWDYMFLQRPGFLYFPDMNGWQQEGAFYTRIEDWPFEAAASNEELCEKISGYDEKKAMNKIENHKEALGNVEDGQACEKLVAYIYKKVCS
ncbi:MAG: CDP-glycerol glycerophosphotransferase family protein [Roseburia sp.]|nr:CDP-glycerol glycerophosphotransferase family protein [Roseburia sp.]MCM1278122.1 CDP-glycerol glycerophosphotransferase family protein [Robinsoniella sp.]